MDSCYHKKIGYFIGRSCCPRIMATNDSGFLANSSNVKMQEWHTYIVLGASVILLDFVIFIVLLKDRSLLNQSSSVFGIALGNFIQGLYLLWNGLYHVVYVADLTMPASTEACLGYLFPVLFPLGLNTSASFLCLGGVERFLAVNYPVWFHKHWSNKTGWSVTAAVFGGCLVPALIGTGLALEGVVTITFQCSARDIFGVHFVLFCSLFTAFGGASGAVLTLIGLIRGLKRLRKTEYASGDAGRLKRQIQLAKSMLMISVSDLGLVAVPSLLSALTLANLVNIELPSSMKVFNSFYTNCANAMATFLALVMFNRSFRQAAMKLFHCGQKTNVAAVKVAFVKTDKVHPVRISG